MCDSFGAAPTAGDVKRTRNSGRPVCPTRRAASTMFLLGCEGRRLNGFGELGIEPPALHGGPKAELIRLEDRHGFIGERLFDGLVEGPPLTLLVSLGDRFHQRLPLLGVQVEVVGDERAADQRSRPFPLQIDLDEPLVLLRVEMRLQSVLCVGVDLASGFDRSRSFDPMNCRSARDEVEDGLVDLLGLLRLEANICPDVGAGK